MMQKPKYEVILNFHGLGKPNDNVAPSELPYWISESFFSEIVDLVRERKSCYPTRFTFDDGNCSDIEIAVPILRKNEMVASFFVLVGRMEESNYLSKDQTKLLTNMGMEVGLHGRHHVDWRYIDSQSRWDEIVVARGELEDAVGRAVNSVAIPFGAYNRRVFSMLRRQGFERIYTSDGGLAHRTSVVQPRCSIRSDMSLGDVERLLCNGDRIQSRIRRKASCFVRQHIV